MYGLPENVYRRTETELTAQYFIKLSSIKHEPLYKQYAISILVKRNFYDD